MAAVTLVFDGATNPVLTPIMMDAGHFYSEYLPATPTHQDPNLTFIGWHTAAGDLILGSYYVPDVDHTLYAKYTERIEVHVLLDANGGEPPLAPNKLCYYGAAYSYDGVLLDAEHSNPAMVFDGWWTTQDVGGTRVYDATVCHQKTDHVLYARWHVDYNYAGATVKVSFNANGGYAVDPFEVSLTSGSAYGDLPAPLPADSDLRFDGWWTAADGGFRVDDATLVPAVDHILYAHWRSVGHTVYVTYVLEEGSLPGGVDVRAPITQPGGGYQDLPLPTHPDSNLVFDGWWTEPVVGGMRVEDGYSAPDKDHFLFGRWRAWYLFESAFFEKTEDGEWVKVTVEAVAYNLPKGLAKAFGLFDTRLETRLSRLDSILSGVLLDFRSAVNADEHSVAKLDPKLLPFPCLRHLQMMVWYFLGLEIDYAEIHKLASGWKDSEVYLRSLAMATRSGNNRFADKAGNTPLYSGVDGRAVSGSSGSVPLIDSGTSGVPNYFAPG